MNIIKYKIARLKRDGLSRSISNRDGLSVIEVLTSIVVALIGVFGVMAMIPFSVKQTQSGLDNDAATSMARNALANFEASGYKVVSGTNNQLNWLDNDGSTVLTTAAASANLICIDPLGVTEEGLTSFPFHNDKLIGDLALPNSLEISTATLSRPDGAAFSIADARRMFRLTDDLVFAESDDPSDPDSDLLGPVQLFNDGPAGRLNRQSNGTVSWCAIAQPIINDSAMAETVDSYKFYVLVFKDRLISVDPDTTVTDGKMAAAKVISPTTFTQAATVTIETVLDDTVNRGDWVMLINEEAGSEPNISFARIANLFSNESAGTSSISLDGPDFKFTNDTYIVHLRDVVAVFPRTIKVETNSNWTVSAD